MASSFILHSRWAIKKGGTSLHLIVPPNKVGFLQTDAVFLSRGSNLKMMYVDATTSKLVSNGISPQKSTEYRLPSSLENKL